jgi:hypothetical protein
LFLYRSYYTSFHQLLQYNLLGWPIGLNISQVMAVCKTGFNRFLSGLAYWAQHFTGNGCLQNRFY